MRFTLYPGLGMRTSVPIRYENLTFQYAALTTKHFPKVCGEDCRVQICPICAPESDQNAIVDLIMQRRLREVDVDQGTLDELLITIPDACIYSQSRHWMGIVE